MHQSMKGGLHLMMKDLKINWQLSSDILKLSNKDQNSPSLSNTKDLFD